MFYLKLNPWYGSETNILNSNWRHTRRPELRSRWTTALEQCASQDSPARQRHRRISSAVWSRFCFIGTAAHSEWLLLLCAWQILFLTHSFTHTRVRPCVLPNLMEKYWWMTLSLEGKL